MKALDLLKKYNACDEAEAFVVDMTIQEAWETCPRGDWMLWLYQKAFPDNLQELTLAKGHCANTVRHLLKDKRSIKAIDTAIMFGEGIADREDLKAAADAAYAAVYYTSHTATADATYAAYAAANVTTDVVTIVATIAADAAADAATHTVAYATAKALKKYSAAKAQNQQETANICRQYLDISSLY